jgi:tripartite-type tricarboxylate transporter receptor subunit TctC
MIIGYPGPIALAVAAIGAIGAMPCAIAQSFPSKPVRIVVPYPAGGPIDLVFRPLAQRLTEAMGGPVLIDTRPGANGLIGIEHVAKSPADGYSLVVGTGGSFAINSVVYAKLPFDVVRDFAPVSRVVNLPELLCVHPVLPVKNIRELVALAKARPDQLNYGSAGAGSTPHLAGELFSRAAGVRMTHIAYKGAGPATMDLIGGHVQLMFADIPVLLPHARSGKLRALAVATPKRSQALPDVQTIAEQGYPEVDASNWYALFAPAATPKEIIARLHAETARILAQPETKAFYLNQGAEAAATSPAELAELLRAEIVKWGKVVKAANIRLD